MAESPWIRFFASDFLTGVADLQADEIGAYMVVLALIFDKGAPIRDDSAWLARRSGCSTRRFNQIRAKLIAAGKLESRAEMLGNRKALEEIKRRDDKSNKTRHAALARWYRGDEPELPLDDGENAKPPIISGKNGEKVQEQIDLKSPVKSEKRQKSAISPDADASGLAGAREEPELEIDKTHSPANPIHRVRDDAVDGPSDLLGLTHRLCKTGGVALINPTSHAREMDIVKSWIELGYDIEGMVLPSIADQLANTRESRISSLSFYAQRIAKRYAQGGGSTPDQKAAWPPERQKAYTDLMAFAERNGIPSSKVKVPAPSEPYYPPDIRETLVSRTHANGARPAQKGSP